MPDIAQRWILSGMSGAGKHTARLALEAAGVTVVDNLPVDLLATFVADGDPNLRVAIMDSRRGHELAALPESIPRVLYLEARDEVLRKRLSESTVAHPCARVGNADAQIAAERSLLQPIRAEASAVLDTSTLSAVELGAQVLSQMGVQDKINALVLRISSFGYKRGVALDADCVLDARFLRNPFWVPELRKLTGRDAVVRDYVMADATTESFLAMAEGLISWSVVRARASKRAAWHVAIGCTGGRHRSVAVAEELARRIDGENLHIVVNHRDVDIPDPR